MPDIYALIPAAGSGVRMGAGIPKQYQLLAGKPLIVHALETLCAHSLIRGVFVVLAPDDTYFQGMSWRAPEGKLSTLYCGGGTRAASVLNGLLAMADQVHGDDWVMVHDAARPCLTTVLIDRLLTQLASHAVGGLLAVPVADTLKRADANDQVEATVLRDQVWQAQTPQMFRHGLLQEALRRVDMNEVTDESAAVEKLGHRPQLVMGSPSNLKVTRPEDLPIAEFFLKTRQ